MQANMSHAISPKTDNGQVPERPSKKGKQIAMRLAPYTVWQLENYADKMGLKKSAVVTIALEKYLSEEARRAAK
jgi:hypothetical protein